MIRRLPIHEAVAAGDAELVEKLLAEHGDDAMQEIERLTPDRLTALMIAVMSPRADVAIVERLIASGAAIHRAGGMNWDRGDALYLALRAGDVLNARPVEGMLAFARKETR